MRTLDIDGYLASLKTIGHITKTEVRLEGWFTAEQLMQIGEKLTQNKGTSDDSTRPVSAGLLQDEQ